MKVLENVPDEQLLIAEAQRDPSRFAALYESNFDRLYAYVARRVATRQDAEDLTAEVFHEALRNLDRFEWRGVPFAGWLIGIAANLLADGWRRAERQQEFLTDDLNETGVDEKIEERTMLCQLVDGLPQDQKLVIIRRFVEQKSLREIAREFGRSTGAIKQLQFRALQNLRMRMESRHVQ